MKNLIKIIVLVFIFTFSIYSNAQGGKKIFIKGQVLDSKKNPVANTIIFVDNVKQERKTSSKGYYTLNLHKRPKKIVFYSEKYGILDYIYTGKKIINIKFDIPAAKNLTSVKSKSQKRNPDNFRYTNIYEYIRGKVAGVQVLDDLSIRVRGITSLNGSNEPLFVLDKIVLFSNASIRDINPNDIKSVKVLKGSDASIYGVRGAAGVIVITTRK
jgi:TonB-dependent SusC/RagA subfamily outer membrane receptor